MFIVMRVLFLVAYMPLWVSAQPADQDCTKLTDIDLYILFDIGGRTLVSDMQRGYDYLRRLIDYVDISRTRIAFWTGERCNYIKTSRVRKVYNESCSEAIANTYRFDLDEHGRMVDHQKRFNIKTKLNEYERHTITNDEYMMGREVKGRAGLMLNGIQWLSHLKSIKRLNAELATFVITYSTRDEGDLNAARTAAADVSMMAMPRTRTLRSQLPALPWSFVGTSSDFLSNRIVSIICENLYNCHYVTNETVRQQAECDWDSNENCRKDLTRLYVILKPRSGSGTECPTPPVESCPEARCNDACNNKHADQWGQWSSCSVTCGGTGTRIRTRIVRHTHAPRRCPREARETCYLTTPCIDSITTRTQYTVPRTNAATTVEPHNDGQSGTPWYYIIFFVLGAIAVFIGIAAYCVLKRRRKRKKTVVKDIREIETWSMQQGSQKVSSSSESMTKGNLNDSKTKSVFTVGPIKKGKSVVFRPSVVTRAVLADLSSSDKTKPDITKRVFM